MFDKNKITPRHLVNRFKKSTRQLNLPEIRRKFVTKTPYLYIVFLIPDPSEDQLPMIQLTPD